MKYNSGPETLADKRKEPFEEKYLDDDPEKGEYTACSFYSVPHSHYGKTNDITSKYRKKKGFDIPGEDGTEIKLKSLAPWLNGDDQKIRTKVLTGGGNYIKLTDIPLPGESEEDRKKEYSNGAVVYFGEKPVVYLAPFKGEFDRFSKSSSSVDTGTSKGGTGSESALKYYHFEKTREMFQHKKPGALSAILRN